METRKSVTEIERVESALFDARGLQAFRDRLSLHSRALLKHVLRVPTHSQKYRGLSVRLCTGSIAVDEVSCFNARCQIVSAIHMVLAVR